MFAVQESRGYPYFISHPDSRCSFAHETSLFPILLEIKVAPFPPFRIAGQPLQEPVAWYGPIVMNTQAELRQAFEELERGTFLK